jgi:hypothetical protein
MNTSIEGFYAVYMSAKQGQGFAMLVLRKGLVVGVDTAGFMFDGQYIDTGAEALSVSMSVKGPPNVPRLQGGMTGPQGEESKLSFHMPRIIDPKRFVRVETQYGPVNARLVKLRGIDE